MPTNTPTVGTVERIETIQEPVASALASGWSAEESSTAGMISEHLDVPIGDALVRLRAYAYAALRPIDDVAGDVIARRLLIDEPPV